MEIPPHMNRRIFLAGASGAIGRRLAPLLVDADYEVFGTTAVKLSDSQIAALDQIIAPPSLYPNWFNTNMVDDKHKEIFGTNRAELFLIFTQAAKVFPSSAIEGIFNRCCQGVCRKWNGMYESSCVVPRWNYSVDPIFVGLRRF